jgi:glutathione S-transferase
MAMAAARMDPEHREILLRDKPKAMLAISPKGTVPVFLTSDGVVIEESLDIMLHALSLGDPPRWLRNQHCVKRRALLEDNDGPFKTALDRYKYASRAASDDDGVDVAAAVDETSRMLREIERTMAGAPFIDGTSMGLFDVAIFPFIRQLAGVDLARFEATAPTSVTSWLHAMTTAREFTKVMAKVPRWSSGDAPRCFLDTLVHHTSSQ